MLEQITKAELHKQYYTQPSQKVLNELVKMYYNLVHKFVHQLKNTTKESYEDLFQLGCLGLIRAIRAFDPMRGTAFSSFAVPYIKGEILHYLRDKSALVRVPRSWHEAYAKIRSLEKNGIQDSQQQCEILGINADHLEAIKKACREKNNPQELPIYLVDSKNQSIDRFAVSYGVAEKLEILQHKLELLLPKERKAIELLYFQGLSLEKAASGLKMSKRQLQAFVQDILAKLSFNYLSVA